MSSPTPGPETTDEVSARFTERVTSAVRIGAVGLALLLFIWFSLEILLLIFCGILLAVAMDGAARLVNHHTRLPRGLSLTLVVILLLVLMAVLITTATPTLVAQVQVLADTVPAGFDNLQEQLTGFGWGQELLSFLDRSREQILDLLAGRSELLSGLTGMFSQTLDVVTALMTFIPNFGPLIAAVPALLLAFSVSPMTGVYVLILLLVIQNLEGAFITPIIHRNMIALPPALIISVQVLLAAGVGFIGLLVAMPLVAVTMVLVERLYVEDVLER